MKEDLVQFIWENLLFDTFALKTTTGDEIEIINSGTVQHGQGPDIENALIRINGQLWAGMVEVHKRASEWYEHGHQNDALYENVILHVVMENDLSARTVSGRKIPTLELRYRVSSDLLHDHQRLMSNSAWVSCEKDLPELNMKAFEPWFAELLDQRLKRKAHEMLRQLDVKQNDVNEAFYSVLLRAFGLKENQDAMTMLAQKLPFNLLSKYRKDRLKLEALLLGTAGLLQVNMITGHARKLQAEFQYLKDLHKLELMPMSAWRFGRIRPSAFPTVRLALFAALVESCEGDISTLLHESHLPKLHELLSVKASKDWNFRYTVDELSTSKVKSLGRTVRELIIVNAIVPFTYALSLRINESEAEGISEELLSQMPPAKDRIVSTWQRLGVPNNNMARSQALLELKNEFCNARKCLTCSIGKRLLKHEMA